MMTDSFSGKNNDEDLAVERLNGTKRRLKPASSGD
jgi:hypothetical protein